MDCSLLGSSIHGIFQGRIMEWVAISFSRRSSQPKGWTGVSCIVGRHLPPEPPGKSPHNSEDKDKRPEKRTVVSGTAGEGHVDHKGVPVHSEWGNWSTSRLGGQSFDYMCLSKLTELCSPYPQVPHPQIQQISDSGGKFLWQSSKTTKLQFTASQQLFTQRLHCIRYYKKSEMV